MKLFVKDYYRKKHGRADYGGEVGSHFKNSSSFHRLSSQLADRVYELRKEGYDTDTIRKMILTEVDEGKWLTSPKSVKYALEEVLEDD